MSSQPDCIYLDYHATTPVDPEVFAAMEPYFKDHFGNPSSASHQYGWDAEAAVNTAREQVAKIINAQSKEIIFTSGATESLNLAILGVMLKDESKKAHFITSNAEHKATLTIADALKDMGYPVTILPVDQFGQIHPEQVREAITPDTALISLIFANNEVGTINPIHEIGQIALDNGILFHVDAAQAVGKFTINVEELNVHLLSLSGHKIYGPKGVGALYVRSKNPRVQLKQVIFGGGQERGVRPGTLNVPSLVGLGKACEIANLSINTEKSRTSQLRDKMWSELCARIPNLQMNGHPEQRLANNLNISISGVYPDLLMARIQGIAVSSGSACSSGSVQGSHVLEACGYKDDARTATLRIGLGRYTTQTEIDKAIEIITLAFEKSRVQEVNATQKKTLMTDHAEV